MNQTTIENQLVNQSNIVITNSEEFERIINTLKESLLRMSGGFDKEKDFMKKIDKTDTWSGEVQEKVYAKYQELSNCYNPVVESLSTYVKFLENTINSYKASENTINNSIEENLDNLNVN